jgi:hypothetical protein
MTEDGSHRYPIKDGIYNLMPAALEKATTVAQPGQPELRNEKRVVRDFYDQFGWKPGSTGEYGDTVAFVDKRPRAYSFTERCMQAVGENLPRSGKYILDAGSGAIPHRPYLDYDKGFVRRICVDISIQALKEARSKVGERGIYVLGDITNLPIKDGIIDAAICNHVIYHIPVDEQSKAFLELWRVIKERSGRAVIVYSWKDARLPWRLGQIARALRISGTDASEIAMPPLYYHPQSRQWFESQPWPFKYKLMPFRLVDNGFLKKYIGDDIRSRMMLAGMSLLQRALPRFSGRHGQYPVIIIDK